MFHVEGQTFNILLEKVNKRSFFGKHAGNCRLRGIEVLPAATASIVLCSYTIFFELNANETTLYNLSVNITNISYSIYQSQVKMIKSNLCQGNLYYLQYYL